MIYKHKNGYSAKLYGKSSMTIYRPDGTEFSHTGSRNVNTEAEVMQLLGKQQELEKILTGSFNDILNDTEDEDI